MKTIIISDTHGLHRTIFVPPGDILIHAGDITNRGDVAQIKDFNAWLGAHPHAHKIVIAGNHDFYLENEYEKARALLSNCTYLCDQTVEINGLKFYGSPWQPWFYDWAFNLRRGPEIRAKWDLIPDDVDVLITHGPPMGIGDRTHRGDKVGCADLKATIDRVKPRLHIFGHIHEGYGQYENNGVKHINASICDLKYQPNNAAIVLELYK